MPNQPFYSAGVDISDAEHKLFQKRKWQVLIGTFLLVLICANAAIWSQAPVFQSQSVLHFSYKSKTDQGFSEFAQRQITLHQQRLKSNSVLSSVSQELERSQGLMINVQTLFQALSIESSLTSRIISLSANGNEPQILKPILDALSKVYLQLIEFESQNNNNEELQLSSEQLGLLEVKIVNQQQLLELFAVENNITSLERDENRILSQVKNLGVSLDQTVAEQLSLNVLRHTYITYLASQGAKLNDIEQVAGYTSPSILALYRNINQQGKLLDLEQIQTQYPFVVKG